MKKNEGIIIYNKKIKEKDLYIKILSKNDEIDSGIVYAGTSSKKKLIFQTGYFIEYTLIKKNENSPPYFNAEIIKPFINNLIKNKFKLYGLLNLISLMNISIIEGQKVIGFYDSIKYIINIMDKKKHWISHYCEWFFILLKIIGYEIDYKNKSNLKYYDLTNDKFEEKHIENSIQFPHHLLNHSNKIILHEVSAVFEIFENIYRKNHLHNINYKMRSSFYNFKKAIIKELK